jgi:hypothetical protein
LRTGRAKESGDARSKRIGCCDSRDALAKEVAQALLNPEAIATIGTIVEVLRNVALPLLRQCAVKIKVDDAVNLSADHQ